MKIFINSWVVKRGIVCVLKGISCPLSEDGLASFFGTLPHYTLQGP